MTYSTTPHQILNVLVSLQACLSQDGHVHPISTPCRIVDPGTLVGAPRQDHSDTWIKGYDTVFVDVEAEVEGDLQSEEGGSVARG